MDKTFECLYSTPIKTSTTSVIRNQTTVKPRENDSQSIQIITKGSFNGTTSTSSRTVRSSTIIKLRKCVTCPVPQSPSVIAQEKVPVAKNTSAPAPTISKSDMRTVASSQNQKTGKSKKHVTCPVPQLIRIPKIKTYTNSRASVAPSPTSVTDPPTISKVEASSITDSRGSPSNCNFAKFCGILAALCIIAGMSLVALWLVSLRWKILS